MLRYRLGCKRLDRLHDKWSRSPSAIVDKSYSQPIPGGYLHGFMMIMMIEVCITSEKKHQHVGHIFGRSGYGADGIVGWKYKDALHRNGSRGGLQGVKAGSRSRLDKRSVDLSAKCERYESGGHGNYPSGR